MTLARCSRAGVGKAWPKLVTLWTALSTIISTLDCGIFPPDSTAHSLHQL